MALYNGLTDENWDMLIDEINQKNCILMLGPDAAVAEGQKRPLTEILANELAEKIEPEDKKNINTSDLAQVAQCYCKDENKRYYLEKEVRAFYEERKTLCSNFHRDLAALPFNFIVTTTPDHMILEALKKENKKTITKGYNFRGKNPPIMDEWSPDNPLVFYLYGTLDEPTSLLLTEKNLLDYLEALIKHDTLQRKVLYELQDEVKNFLFLGFGFKHWYLRILLHVLWKGKKVYPSFAMEQLDKEHKDTDQLRQTLLFFRRSNHKIDIFKQPLDKFASQLREKYKKKYSQPEEPTAKPTVIHKDGPEVFICHASEDKEFAEFLNRELEKAGLRPWLDKEKLRCGDNWDREIKKTLKDVDYFVIIQSHNLGKEKESYVYMEIQYALERKRHFKPGALFILPVVIDGSDLLEELRDIQYVDLSDESNRDIKIKKLIDTINLDFE